MADDDSDFWTTYIASTPEQDADFAPAGKPIAWIVVVVIAFIVAMYLLH